GAGGGEIDRPGDLVPRTPDQVLPGGAIEGVHPGVVHPGAEDAELQTDEGLHAVDPRRADVDRLEGDRVEGEEIVHVGGEPGDSEPQGTSGELLLDSGLGRAASLGTE